MTDEQNTLPEQPEAGAEVNTGESEGNTVNLPEASAEVSAGGNNNDFHDAYDERLERLGGEPAPVITPEEFARLQRAGQVHIDAKGRVRTTRRTDAEAGVSLRKRRAWYSWHLWYSRYWIPRA